MRHDAILDALGDATRRSILGLLRHGPRAVGELAEALPVTQPAVSQHLRVLLSVGVVEVEKAGRHRIYRLRPEGWAPLREYVESFWSGALDAFRDSFEQTGRDGR
jgi:DNA-binding transcriptional ArsR family regulator